MRKASNVRTMEHRKLGETFARDEVSEQGVTDGRLDDPDAFNQAAILMNKQQPVPLSLLNRIPLSCRRYLARCYPKNVIINDTIKQNDFNT